MKAPVQHRILFVDDNPILRACLGDYLTFHGFEVRTAANGKEAFKVMRKYEPDLIIVDPVMPGKKGTRFLKHLTLGSGVLRYPVLVYTAGQKMETFYSGTRVEGYLSKEAPELELVKKAKSILAKCGRHLTFAEEEPGKDEPVKTAKKPKPAPEPAGETPEAGVRVLLTEDDGRVAQSLKRHFEKNGYAVQVAHKPAELLAMAADSHPDVILIKEVLSGTSGSLTVVELAESTDTQSIPVVLYDDTKTLSDRVAHRLQDLSTPLEIVRNAKPAALQEAVETLVGRGQGNGATEQLSD